MIETAYQILSAQQEPLPFLNLFNQICETLKLTKAQADSKIASFFSDLSLDNRFVSKPGNKWDLKKRSSVSDRKIDLEALSLEDDDEVEE